MFYKKTVFKNFAKFTGKHLYARPSTLLKKRLRQSCLSENFAKFIRPHFRRTLPGDCFCFSLEESNVSIIVLRRSILRIAALLKSSFRSSSHRRYSVRKGVLKISQNSQENTCANVSFLIKLQASGLQLY